MTPDRVDTLVSDVIAMLAEFKKVEEPQWGPETTLSDVGMDSFDFIEFIFLLEDRYDVEIQYNANETFETVPTIGSLVDRLRGLIGARKA